MGGRIEIGEFDLAPVALTPLGGRVHRLESALEGDNICACRAT